MQATCNDYIQSRELSFPFCLIIQLWYFMCFRAPWYSTYTLNSLALFLLCLYFNCFFAWEIIMIPKRFESFKILCLEREYSRWGVDFACSWPGLYCGIVYGPLWRITSSAVNPEHIIRRKPWALMSVVSPPLQKNNVSYNKWLFLVHVSQTSIYCHSL